MKTRILKNVFLTVSAIALFGATNAMATAYTSTAGGGNWNASGTWSPSGVPGASDTAAIAATAPVSVSDTEAVTSMTIQKGAALTIGTGGNLTVSSTITQSGGSSGTSTVTLSGGSGTLNLNATATSFTSVTLAPGTSGSTVNYGGAGATVYAAAYDNLTLSGGGIVTVNSTTTAINLTLNNGTGLTPASGKLSSITGNVTLSGASGFTNSANIVVGGNFTVNDTSSFINNNGNASLTVTGNVSVASTATFGLGSGAGNASTLILDGSSQTISGGGTLTCQIVTVNGSYTLQSGVTLSIGNKNAGIGNQLGGTGSLANHGTLVIGYSDAYSSAVTISSLDCSATGNMLQLNEGNGTATTLPAAVYYNIYFNPTGGGDSVSLANATSVGGNLTVGGSNGSVSGLVTGWPATGIAGEVIYNSSKPSTLPATSLSIGGFNQSAGTVTLPAGGTLVVTSTGTSAFTRSGGTFTTAAGSIVSFTGAIPVIGGTVENNFASLNIGGTSTATNLEPLVVTNNLIVASGGVLDVTALGTYTLYATQSVINAGTIVGNLGTAGTSLAKIYAETNGVFSTNTITGTLALNGTNSINLDLNSTAAGPNDLVAVGGALTLNNTVFNLQAPSAGASIDTANNYTLVKAQSISGTPVLNWVPGFVPANSANYSLAVVGGTVVLQYTGSSNPAPVIMSIIPNTGSTNGGTLVTINGANFLSNPAVTFGALPANNITYVNSTEITVTTPAQSAGPVTVIVTDTDSQTATGSYTYVLPPAPAVGSVASANASSETVVWTGGANQNCVLMSTTNLSQPNWTAVATNTVGANGLSTNVIPINLNQPVVFYNLSIPYN